MWASYLAQEFLGQDREGFNRLSPLDLSDARSALDNGKAVVYYPCDSNAVRRALGYLLPGASAESMLEKSGPQPGERIIFVKEYLDKFDVRAFDVPKVA